MKTTLLIFCALSFCFMEGLAKSDPSMEDRAKVDRVVVFFAPPIGSLSFASIHEAGHVVTAKSVGMKVTGARVFLQSRGGFSSYWKGATTLRANGNSQDMAVVKMGGNFAEFFIDDSNVLKVPSFLSIVGNRNTISQSDVVTAADLGGASLLDAQHRTYRALSGNTRLLHSVFHKLLSSHVYP